MTAITAVSRGIPSSKTACQARLATAAGQPGKDDWDRGRVQLQPGHLGALGDGGDHVTNDAALSATLRGFVTAVRPIATIIRSRV